MSAIGHAVALGASFSGALTGACLVARQGYRFGLTDTPNDRSSHSSPRPRGGGLGILIAVNCVVAFAAPFDRADVTIVALLGGGLLVGCVGLVDDIRSVPAIYRLLIHLAASALVVIGMPDGWSIQLFDSLRLAGVAGGVVGVIAIAWAINLFNFMDGIDGIAGAEAIFVTGAGSLLVWFAHPGHPLVLAFAIVAAAAAGFLVTNWPPSRVFMGDVGSGFLGYAIAALAFWASAVHVVSLWTWLILMAAFLVDATMTMIRRALRGERVYAAHRMHAYQKLSRKWSSHRRVTLLVIGIDLFWLLPCALASVAWPAFAPAIAVISALPIGVGAWLAKAGVPELSP